MAQVNGLRNCGLEVDLCHQLEIDGNRFWVVNNKPFAKIGHGFRALLNHYTSFKPLTDIAVNNCYDAVYLRYVHNGNAFMLSFFKKLKKTGIKLFVEIPTFPYDGEYKDVKHLSKVRVLLEKMARQQFNQYISRIITFSEDASIFRVPTIQMSNAVDMSSIVCRTILPKHDEIRFVAVANLNFWHGYDRMIYGFSEYYKNGASVKVYLDMVGSGEIYEYLKSLAKELCVDQYITFHGVQSGFALDIIFDTADIAVGCLGCHRKGIKEVKSLKNVEYAARGIPMLYSEDNTDFDTKDYVIKVPADESPINIAEILKKFAVINKNPQTIRDSVSHLDWNIQMKKVTDIIKKIF